MKKFAPLAIFVVGIIAFAIVVIGHANGKHPPIPPEVWRVTEHAPAPAPYQPVILPNRDLILKTAAEMVKAKLRSKSACGEPFCDCGCNEGGFCICRKTQKTAPAQKYQMQCGPNGCQMVPVQSYGGCSSGSCGVSGGSCSSGGCSSGSCGSSGGRRLFGRRR